MKSSIPIKIILVLLLATGVAFLGGCESDHRLRIGSSQWPGYEPLYLARDKGLLPSDSVKLLELPSASEVIQYLRMGSLDGGMLTLDEMISLRAEGIPLTVVLVMDISDGADTILGQPGIDGLTKIKGRRIGVEITAVGAVMLESVLQEAGLSQQDVDLVNLPVDQHFRAFQDHQVDVLITYEPTRSRLLAEGAVELFNSGQILGRIVDVLAIRDDAMEHHRDHIAQLIDGYFAARKMMDADTRQAYARMAPRLQTDLETLKTMFAGLQLPDPLENLAWLGGASLLSNEAQKLAALMAEWNLIETQPDLTHLATAEFIPAP